MVDTPFMVILGLVYYSLNHIWWDFIGKSWHVRGIHGIFFWILVEKNLGMFHGDTTHGDTNNKDGI